MRNLRAALFDQDVTLLRAPSSLGVISAGGKQVAALGPLQCEPTRENN